MKHVRKFQAIAVVLTVAVAATVVVVATASDRHLMRIDHASTTVVQGHSVKARLLVSLPKHAHLAAAIDDGKLKAVTVHHHTFVVSTRHVKTGKHTLVVAFVDHKGHRIAQQKAHFHIKKPPHGDGTTPPTSTTNPPSSTTKPPTSTTKPPTSTTKAPTTTTKPPTTTTPTTPTGSDNVPPTTPGSLVVASGGKTSVSVSWHASSDNVGVVGYRVAYAGAAPSTVTSTSTTIGGLSCGVTITVTVAALDKAGNASTPASAFGGTDACPVVAADHYVSATGNDSGQCTQAAPCKTLGRAYLVSSAGQTVSVAPGTYPGQSIPVDGSKTSTSDVTFLGNGAATGEIDVYGSHVSLQDFNTGGWTAEQGSTDLTFKNVNVANGGEFFVDSATNVSVIGGVVDGAGQYWSNGNQVKTMSTTAPIPSGILIDGITIKNFRRDPRARTTSTACTSCRGTASPSVTRTSRTARPSTSSPRCSSARRRQTS